MGRKGGSKASNRKQKGRIHKVLKKKKSLLAPANNKIASHKSKLKNKQSLSLVAGEIAKSERKNATLIDFTVNTSLALKRAKQTPQEQHNMMMEDSTINVQQQPAAPQVNNASSGWMKPATLQTLPSANEIEKNASKSLFANEMLYSLDAANDERLQTMRQTELAKIEHKKRFANTKFREKRDWGANRFSAFDDDSDEEETVEHNSGFIRKPIFEKYDSLAEGIVGGTNSQQVQVEQKPSFKSATLVVGEYDADL